MATRGDLGGNLWPFPRSVDLRGSSRVLRAPAVLFRDALLPRESPMVWRADCCWSSRFFGPFAVALASASPEALAQGTMATAGRSPTRGSGPPAPRLAGAGRAAPAKADDGHALGRTPAQGRQRSSDGWDGDAAAMPADDDGGRARPRPPTAGRRADDQHPAERGRAGRGHADRPHRHQRQPPRREGRHHHLPAREAGPPLQGREPRQRRARALGLGLLRRHRGRPDPRRSTASSCASSCASARTSRRSSSKATARSRTTSSRRRSRSRRTRSSASRPSAAACRRSGRLRREGLLPRRRRERDRAAARQRGRSSSSTITEHAPVTVRRITFVGNHNVPDDELRDGHAHRPGRLLRLRLGRPVSARTSSSATSS